MSSRTVGSLVLCLPYGCLGGGGWRGREGGGGGWQGRKRRVGREEEEGGDGRKGEGRKRWVWEKKVKEEDGKEKDKRRGEG